MRTFQLYIVLSFLIFYLLLVAGSYFNLKRIFPSKRSKKFLFIYTGFSLIILFTFFYLYIFPNTPRDSGNIRFYFFFNIVLVALITFNLPVALSGFLHLIFSRKKGSTSLLFAGLLLGIGFSAEIAYGAFWGSRQLKIEEREISFANLPQEFHNFRIVQISDFHLGGLLHQKKFLTRIQHKISSLDPDLLLFTGDFVNNFSREFDGLEAPLKAMSTAYQSFSILGNHDYGDYSRWKTPAEKQANFEAIREKEHGLGFRLLCNENAIIHRGEDSIFIAGVENWGHPPFPQYADLEKALSGVEPDAFTILMTHDPAHWQAQIAGKKNIPLTLSGHTHGMQWGIKLAGIPFSVAALTRKQWGGLYRSGNSYLYVNTGIGTVGMPWRLDMPPEITLFTLKRTEID